MPELTLAVRLSADGRELVGELRGADKAMQELIDSTEDTGKASDRASRQIDRMADQTDRLGGSTVSLTSGLFNLRNTIAALGIGALVRDIAQAGIQMQGWESSLRAATGSTEAAGSAIGFVRAEADRLGLEFAGLTGDYATLTAAAKGTALEGQVTRDLFSAIAEQSTVLRLSVDDTSGVITAFSQILSKGTVSMEEIQQISERVPGTLQRVADAMGLSAAETIKMISSGKVLAEDLLPALAKEFQESVADALPDAVDSAQSAFNRLSNSLFNLKVAIAESGLLDFLANIAKAGVAAIDTLSKLLIKLGLVAQEDSIARINEQIEELIEKRNRLLREIGQRNQGILPFDAERSREIRQQMLSINELLGILSEELRLVKKGANETSTATNNLGGSLGGVSGKAGDAAKGFFVLNSALEAFRKSIITDAEATQLLFGKIEILDKLLRQEIITWEEYERRIEAVTGKQSEFSETVEKTKEPVSEITELADPFADAWERAIDEIDQSFVDLWKSAFSGFEDFSEALKNTFQTLLAELAHAAITRPILVQLGLGGAITGGGVGGAFGGGAGGLFGGFGGAGTLGSAFSGLFGGGGSSSALGAIGSGPFGGGARAGAAPTGASGALGALGYGNLAALGVGILGGIYGDDLFGEGGGAGASGGASAGALVGTAIFPGIGTAIGALIGAVAGGLIFGGGKSRPTKLRAGAFPLGTDLSEDAGVTVTSPFGHELGFFGSRIGDKGQISNEDYEQLLSDVTLLFQAVAEIDQIVIDTVGDLHAGDIAEQVESVFARGRITSFDALQKFLLKRFDLLFTEIDEPLGELFNTLSEGMESGEIVALAAGFAGIFSAMEDGKPVFSDVANITETISILFSDFVQEGESLVDTLARLALATKLLSLIGFDDTSVSGSLVAAETQAILGADRMAQLIDTYLGEFFTVEEILQEQLDNIQPKVDELLSDLSTTAETFRADFEQALSGGDITGEAVAAWLETAEALAIVNDLTEQLNQLQGAQGDTIDDLVGSTDDLLAAEREQALAIHQQIIGLDSLNDAYMLATETLAQSVQRQRGELLRLAFAYDGSVESAQQLAGATETLRQVELALLAQIESAASTIDASFGGAIRNIELALLDTEGQYEFLRAEAEALAQVLGTLTDPEQILSTAQQIQTLTSQAFGLLDEEQRKAVGAEFIGFLDAVSENATNQLEAQREATLSAGERVMEVVEASLNRAADQFHNAANRMANAADNMVSAAATMRFASQQPVQAQVIIQSDVVGL